MTIEQVNQALQARREAMPGCFWGIYLSIVNLSDGNINVDWRVSFFHGDSVKNASATTLQLAFEDMERQLDQTTGTVEEADAALSAA